MYLRVYSSSNYDSLYEVFPQLPHEKHELLNDRRAVNH